MPLQLLKKSGSSSLSQTEVMSSTSNVMHAYDQHDTAEIWSRWV